MGVFWILLVVAVGGVGVWALFKAADEDDAPLLGGTRTLPKELPPPPPLPGVYQAASPGVASEAPTLGEPEPDWTAGFVPAGIGQRFVARLVDSIILGIFTAFIGTTVALGAFRRGDPGSARVVLVVAVLIFTLFYEVGFIATLGQTPGKMLRGIRVVSALDGEPPTVAQALVRWAVPSLVGFLPRLIPGPAIIRTQVAGAIGLASLLVYLWAIWDPRKQGLHDKAAQTVVERFR